MHRIVLLGATGYTGSRVLANLADSPTTSEIVLVGRSTERLRRQARTVGVECRTVQADTAAPRALDELLQPGDVVVATVGPFTDIGHEVARSVARTGAVYLDSTGEPPFVDWMFRSLSDEARAGGALLVPGFGYDYVPGNVAGWLAAQKADEQPAAVEMGYFLWRYTAGSADPYRQPSLREMMSTATTPGTRESLVKVLGTPSFAFRADQADRFGLEAQHTGQRLLRFNVAGRERPTITIGGSEHFGLPEVLPQLRSVDVGLGWFGPATTPIHCAGRFGGTLMTNRIVRRAASAVGGRLPYANHTPSIPTRTSVAARARDRSGNLVSEVTVDGPGPYELTADLLARGAQHFAARGEHPVGVHGPLAALTPSTLTELAAACGLRDDQYPGVLSRED